jgi:hypothetical protein
MGYLYRLLKNFLVVPIRKLVIYVTYSDSVCVCVCVCERERERDQSRVWIVQVADCLCPAVGGTALLVLYTAATKPWHSYPPDPQQQYLANLTTRTTQFGTSLLCAVTMAGSSLQLFSCSCFLFHRVFIERRPFVRLRSIHR